METSELISIWRAEKGNNILTAISNEFYPEALAFLASIRQNSFEYDKTKKIYEGVVGIRQHKMLMAVLREVDGKDRPENMTPIELENYVKILNALQSIRTGKESSETVCLTRDEGIKETDEGQEVLGNITTKEGSSEGTSALVEDKKSSATEEDTQKPLTAEEDKKEDEGNNKKEDDMGDKKEDIPSEERAPIENKSHCFDSIDYKKTVTDEHKDTEDLNKVFNSSDDTPTEEVNENPKKEEDENEHEVFKQEAENKEDVIRVRFLKPMPAFVGPDLETLGPFEEEQVLEIVKEIAEILLKNDAVEEA